MEQVTETQAPASQDQIKVLSELIQQLLRERENLSVYSELTKALPSIEEYISRTLLTEEERKIEIHSCPKTSSMNYTSPPLNDTASSTVKTTNYAFYGIQFAYAQATRPIDYYFHRRIQENKGMNTSEDPEILFASTMRALFSDIAATVTQERAITDPVDPHEDPSPNSRMGQVERNSSLGIPRRPAGYGGIQGSVPNKHALILLQALGAWVQCQLREIDDYASHSAKQDPGSPTRSQQISQRWPDDIEMSGELHRQGPVDVSRPATWETDAKSTIRTQEQSSFSIKPIDIDSNADETGNAEPVFVEEPANVILFRQHIHTLLFQEIRGHYLPGTAGINREDMISLPQDQHPPKSDLCSILTKSSGRPQQTDSAKRVVSIAGDIISTELEVWTPRRRPLCIIQEQEAGSIHRWFPGLMSLSISQSLILQATTVAPGPKSGKSPLSENKNMS
ncbi:hypothetical protein AYI70_g6387 [Smittium culicis]|uniref:Uncharacterized protein n=1 Tax=Smittium culicis TaxID=133412 RepID=A0A1R1XQB7_9FUNG|nr:hypothetical protein AYI70_g6387 [Smittium culicis]